MSSSLVLQHQEWEEADEGRRAQPAALGASCASHGAPSLVLSELGRAGPERLVKATEVGMDGSGPVGRTCFFSGWPPF